MTVPLDRLLAATHRTLGTGVDRRLIGRFTNLLGAALCAIFVYYSLSATLASAARGSMRQRVPSAGPAG